MRRAPTAEGVHPGINVSRVPVGGGVAGLMIAVAIVVIGLLGLPIAKWFLGASLALGVLMALVLRWTARGRG